MRDSTRSWLKLELLICFLPCALMLAAGAALLPLEIIRFFTRGYPSVKGPLLVLGFVACGAIGLLTVLRVASALLHDKEIVANPGRALVGVLLGLAPLLLVAPLVLSSTGRIRWQIFTALVALPILATAHLFYLSRRLLCAGFQSERGNEA
jgi:hypothetical protein